MCRCASLYDAVRHFATLCVTLRRCASLFANVTLRVTSHGDEFFDMSTARGTRNMSTACAASLFANVTLRVTFLSDEFFDMSTACTLGA
jgi:hypothetical protein